MDPIGPRLDPERGLLSWEERARAALDLYRRVLAGEASVRDVIEDERYQRAVGMYWRSSTRNPLARATRWTPCYQPIKRDGSPEELELLAMRMVHACAKRKLWEAARAYYRERSRRGASPARVKAELRSCRAIERRAVKRAEEVAAQLEDELERIRRRPSATAELLGA